MGACVYCKQRKGKRACPALKGDICTSCCGSHRLKEIECPSVCSWLGGLSLVQNPAQITEAPTKEAFNAAMSKLFEFVHSPSHKNLSKEVSTLFLGGLRAPDEWEEVPLLGFLAYGYRDQQGRRLLDRFLLERGRDLRPVEVASMMALQRSWASLFEIEAVHMGAGFDLKDLISGEKVSVKEVSATTMLKKWDVFFAWLLPLPQTIELSGACFVVPRPYLEVVTNALLQELSSQKKKRPQAIDRELIGELAWAPIRALQGAFQNVQRPKLKTMHGEDLLFCEARYSLRNKTTARRLLKKSSELLPVGNDFEWQDPKGHPALGDGPLLLGMIRFEPEALTLEVKSRERLERGKLLLTSLLGDLITHEADSIQSPEAMMGQTKTASKTTKKTKEVPLEVQRQVIGQMMKQYYEERWPEMSIPALDGKTPKQAAKTPAGKRKVEAMLKDIEHQTSSQPGGDALDFAAIRRELGLSFETFSLDAYHALQAPNPEQWLAADEQLRIEHVREHHLTLRKHPKAAKENLHMVMHVIVENQLAQDTPETKAALERLCAEGLNRHEAIHAVGSVLSEAIWAILKTEEAFDSIKIAQELGRLRAVGWKGSVLTR
jgi:hypothetical protein